jgi:alkylation response protein AidB-like acyl-CoA dehydrogenase
MSQETQVQGELDIFRTEVRKFVEAELPSDIRRRVLNNGPIEKADYVRWLKILFGRGWVAGHWPISHGGCAWTPLQRIIFEEELYRAGSPWLVPFGITYVGPVIYTFGSAEQQRRHLPGILRSDVWWCQGYSEPDAGSDLTSLRSTALRQGDHYLVNGSKIWTTMAQWADMMFALVRTSRELRPQQGISFLLLDMKSPGITVRPIESLSPGIHLNEVVLENVEVPLENLVGREGEGWTYAKFLLTNERLVVADTGKATRLLTRLWSVLNSRNERGVRLLDNDLWRKRVAELEMKLKALESLVREVVARSEQNIGDGAEASMLKILGSELSQGLSGALLDSVAQGGLPSPHSSDIADSSASCAIGSVREYLHGRAESIYGGSNEIQRNIIAKSMLGLGTRP